MYQSTLITSTTWVVHLSSFHLLFPSVIFFSSDSEVFIPTLLRSRGLLLHLITLNNTHKQHTHTPHTHTHTTYHTHTHTTYTHTHTTHTHHIHTHIPHTHTPNTHTHTTHTPHIHTHTHTPNTHTHTHKFCGFQEVKNQNIFLLVMTQGSYYAS